MCESGFHACERASDCFNYYPFDPRNIKFAEVLCWGEVAKTEDDSNLCCSKIQIVRAMGWEEVLKVCNTGNWNSGYCNTGDWNSGSGNSGFFNTREQKILFCFNKPTEKYEFDFPNFLYFALEEWIPIVDMTDEEKNAHPECDVVGGYLKVYAYKEAFRKSFLKARQGKDWQEELRKLKAIPNFDYKIFEEISGISRKELEG